jgi:thiamine-monophosphate kinase
MVSITAFGFVPQGRMVHRRGAKPTDRIIVTGTIGDAALGLRLRNDAAAMGHWNLRDESSEYLLDRYLLPQPRSALAQLVQVHASAALDVSDGLAGDLAKLCRISGVTAQIEVVRVPLSDPARSAVAAEPALIEAILAGGDDYEILCTVPPAQSESFVAAAQAAGVAAADIGGVMAGEGAPSFLIEGSQPLSLSQTSFSHF